MATTVRQLLLEHSTNPTKDTKYVTGSNKDWTKDFPPITRLQVRTIRTSSGTQADFSAFLDEYEDEDLRFNETAYRPNYRQWRLSSEEDGVNWFHTEISNIVLAAWGRYPAITQASHEKTFIINDDKTVDVAYSVAHNGHKCHVAIGEFKRNLISINRWASGNLTDKIQVALSRELRAYAYLYSCPHIFCFDHSYLLMLQFCAETAEEIRHEDCKVDAWIFPRHDPGVTMRYALYRLLLQGFRRCQGMWPMPTPTPHPFGQAPEYREFYSGQPMWNIGGRYHAKPWGHRRRVDVYCGALYWTEQDGVTPLVDENGDRIWDTEQFWEPEQGQTHVEEDDEDGGTVVASGSGSRSGVW